MEWSMPEETEISSVIFSIRAYLFGPNSTEALGCNRLSSYWSSMVFMSLLSLLAQNVNYSHFHALKFSCSLFTSACRPAV